MKHIFRLIVFGLLMLMGAGIMAQETVIPTGAVKQLTYQRGGYGADSVFGLPVRDTFCNNFIPFRCKGRVTLQPVTGNLYYNDGTKWVLLAKGGEIDTSLFLKWEDTVAYIATKPDLLGYMPNDTLNKTTGGIFTNLVKTDSIYVRGSNTIYQFGSQDTLGGRLPLFTTSYNAMNVQTTDKAISVMFGTRGTIIIPPRAYRGFENRLSGTNNAGIVVGERSDTTLWAMHSYRTQNGRGVLAYSNNSGMHPTPGNIDVILFDSTKRVDMMGELYTVANDNYTTAQTLGSLSKVYKQYTDSTYATKNQSLQTVTDVDSVTTHAIKAPYFYTGTFSNLSTFTAQNSYTNVTGARNEFRAITAMAFTSSPYANSFAGGTFAPQVAATNTQNWTQGQALVGARTTPTMVAGGTGTISGVTGFLSQFLNQSAINVTTFTMFQGLAPANTGGGTISNLVGFNTPSLTAATNNTHVLLGTATAPTGNFSIYDGTTLPSRWGGKFVAYNSAAPTNGQLLIGDGTEGAWDAATLTAGTGIGITNGTGTITISQTNDATGTVSSAGTLTLNRDDNYVFSGTTATWTLPAVSGTAWRTFKLKNRGSGNITINTTASANEIYTTLATNTYTLTPGSAIILVSDGSFWLVE